MVKRFVEIFGAIDKSLIEFRKDILILTKDEIEMITILIDYLETIEIGVNSLTNKKPQYVRATKFLNMFYKNFSRIKINLLKNYLILLIIG